MDVTSLTDVLEPLGPSTTVTIDATENDEHGPRERALRWEDLRGELARAGAPTEDLEAIGEVVTTPTGVGGEVSRFVAARGGQVVLDALLVEGALNGVGSAGTGPILDVVPLLRYEARHAPVVVVYADREGAEIEVLSAVGGPVADAASVHGSTFHIHQVGIGGWSTHRYQHTTQNTWRANAEDVSEKVDHLVRENAAVAVVLSGEQKSRTLIKDRIGAQVPVVEVEGDRRGAGASDRKSVV